MNNKTTFTKRKNVLAAMVGLFAATGAAQQAYGQDGEAATAQFRIDEIIVTAQKREQKLLDVPMSVAAISGEQLAAQGVGDLQSLSLAVPGLMVAETGSFQRRISIRGIGNGFGSSSLVGMYLDEAAVATVPANQIDLRIHDIERIEVLKGPQGTLYGEGSVGGTIRYITRDPQLDGFSGEADIDGSFSKNGDSSQGIKGIINIPLAEDELGLRVVGQYVNSGGWIDQPTLGRKDINDYELFNVRGKLLWQPTDDLEIKTTVIIHKNNTGAQNIREDEQGNYRQLFDHPSTPSGEDNYELYNFTLQYDLDTVSLTSSTSYLDAEKEANNWGNECCFATGNPGEYWHILNFIHKVSSEIITQELRLSSDKHAAFNWTAGLFYKDAKSIPNNIVSGVLGIPGVLEIPFSSYQEENSQSWALFGEASYAISDNLEIGVGLRYFEDDKEDRRSPTGVFNRDTFDSVNPKFYISYGVTEDIRLYFNAAKGFRSGGFNSPGLPSYDPEEVLSYELGTKMALLNGRLNADLALFHSNYDDYQINGVDLSVSASNILSNSGAVDVQGVDLSFRWLATESLELGFNGNYTDTEFTEINKALSNPRYVVGDPVDFVPQYGYSLWSNYSFNWFDQSPGFVRVDYSQQGKSHYRGRNFGPDYHDTSDIIDTLNARVGWHSGEWSLELYAQNLLNERGFIGPDGRLQKNSSRPRPRTVGLNLGVKF